MRSEVIDYQRYLVAETLLSQTFEKKAGLEGLGNTIIHEVYDYFAGKISSIANSDDKLSAIISFIAPGVLFRMGFWQLGVLAKSLEFFGFDIGKILSSLASSIKSALSGDKKLSTKEVYNLASSAVDSNNPSDFSSDQEVEEQIKKFNELSIHEAQIYKLALFVQNEEMKKNAGILSRVLLQKSSIVKVLKSVLSFFVGALLASGGFMVAGDMITNILGIKKELPVEQKQVTNVVAPEPPKSNLKPSSSYSEESFNGPSAMWVLDGSPDQLVNSIIKWTKEIYPETKNINDSDIKNLPPFTAMMNVIRAYNKGGDISTTAIPKEWKSRKDVVDQFINQIQITTVEPKENKEKSPELPYSNDKYKNNMPA